MVVIQALGARDVLVLLHYDDGRLVLLPALCNVGRIINVGRFRPALDLEDRIDQEFRYASALKSHALMSR